MAKFHESLTDELRQFITAQPLFFVATAANTGRVNLSPKGIEGVHCISASQIAYLDLTGSGNETAAHLRADPRITLMFCSFSEKPLILRVYGHGHIIRPQNPRWDQYATLFPSLPGARQIVLIEVDSVQTSCGFGVPRLAMEKQRTLLLDWANKKGDAGIRQYWRDRNQRSIDGIPTGILDD